MPYTEPTYNIDVSFWRFGSGPPAAPDGTAKGNLAWGRRAAAPASGGTGSIGVVFVSPVLLLPAGTDVRDASCGLGPDRVEAPAGTGRFYDAVYVDDIGKGFANEHRAVVLVKAATWPAPIP